MKNLPLETLSASAVVLLTVFSTVARSAKLGDRTLYETNQHSVSVALPEIVHRKAAVRFSTEWANQYFNASLSSIDANNTRGACGAGIGVYKWRPCGMGSNLNSE